MAPDNRPLLRGGRHNETKPEWRYDDMRPCCYCGAYFHVFMHAMPRAVHRLLQQYMLRRVMYTLCLEGRHTFKSHTLWHARSFLCCQVYLIIAYLVFLL